MSPQPPMLTSLSLQGFLSFDPQSVPIPLTPLNVLIGPNGSGKSNFIEALSVLRAVPRDLPQPIRRGGGVRDWLWRDGTSSATEACLETLLAPGWVAPAGRNRRTVRYRLAFGAEGDSFTVLDERLETVKPEGQSARPYVYFGYEKGRPLLNVKDERRELRREDIDPTQSILSQRRDPEAYPELTRLADLLRDILIYRNWHFGPEAPVRSGCRADVRTDTLSETFDNLPARLAVLMRDPATKRRLLELVGELAPGFDDLVVVPEGGALQLYLVEGNRSVPAHRLSDGTLRYLCLLAILLDPGSSPLVVIEEPELGLHPDILPVLRDLLVAASQSRQVVVTTHSTQLVDAMTLHADSVLICEKHPGCDDALPAHSRRGGAMARGRQPGRSVDEWPPGRDALVRQAPKLFVEGGGDNDSLKTECRRAYAMLLEKAGFKGRMPRIVACGGRRNAFDQFATAVGAGEGPPPLLLVDSEEPVETGDPWEHVAHRLDDLWVRPAEATEDQLHFMVQCMEAWFLADRIASESFLGRVSTKAPCPLLPIPAKGWRRRHFSVPSRMQPGRPEPRASTVRLRTRSSCWPCSTPPRCGRQAPGPNGSSSPSRRS
jgi:predicted ATPase